MSVKDTSDSQGTLEAQIADALQNVDDKGNVKFDENVDPLFKHAVLTEQSSRFYQKDYTKSRQELVKVQAEKEALETKLTSTTQMLSTDQLNELDELKYSDPDAWYEQKAKYEQEAQRRADDEIGTLKSEASKKAADELTKTERTEALSEFQVRMGIELTEEMLTNDIPLRIQRKAEKMPFDQYLATVATYLAKNKVVADEKLLDQTNIGNLAGRGEQLKASSNKKAQIL